MKMNRRLKTFGVGFCILAASFLVLRYADLTARGVAAGVDLCLHTVIPSLFMFMVIAEFLSLTDLSEFLFYPMRFLASWFRIPGETVSVFVISLLGGYPAGAQMIANLVRQKKITPQTGEKLLCSCVNCSPSFLIGAVGVSLFHSVQLGAVMYVCQLVAAVLTGIASGLIFRKKGESKPFYAEMETDSKEKVSYVQNFVTAVVRAGKAMFLICCFVVLFSVVFVFLAALPNGVTFAGLLEVSVGCSSLAEKGFREALILATVYTSFGGICVWMQIACFLRKTGVRMKKAFLFRGLYVFLSLFFTLISVQTMQITAETFSTASQMVPKNGSVSVTAAIFLVLLCIMLLITEKRYDKLSTRKIAEKRL